MYKKVLFFLALFFIFSCSINALEPSIEYQDNIYSNRISDNETYSGKLGYIVMNGRVVYCLDPYKIIGNSYIQDNSYFNNMNKEDLTYMIAIANIADSEVQNRNIYYYMAAQELIWDRIIGEGKIFWTTGKNGTGERINIERYKNEIKSNLNLTKPSFDGYTVTSNFRTIMTLDDKNDVLSQYDITGDNKNLISKYKNNLYIKITSSQTDTIKLVKKVGNGEAKFYHSDTNQNLADLASQYEIVSNVLVKANNEYNEDINLNFVDINTLNLVKDNIYFKIKNLDTNTYILDTYTSNGCYLYNFVQGKYMVEVYDVSDNYLLTNISFEVNEMKYSDFSKTISVPLSKPKGILYIYNNDKIALDIYSNNIKIGETNRNDIIDFDLGKYFLIDRNANKKYEISFEYIDAITPKIVKNLYIIKDKEIINNINTSVKDKKEVIDINTSEDKDYIVDGALPNTFGFSFLRYLRIIISIWILKKLL